MRLDPVMVRTLMAQNSLPHLEKRVVPLKCDSCDAMEFHAGEQAFNPHYCIVTTGLDPAIHPAAPLASTFRQLSGAAIQHECAGQARA